MKIINMNASQLIEDNMMSYSAGVLLNRAIPDIRDGFKPSYRHILFSMYKNKTFTYTKSRSIDGDVSKIHPNGSVYPTMIGMAQKDRHHNVLLDGDGWWGSYTSSELTAAADRYTNAKMSDWSRFLFRDVDKGIVDFEPNYDGTIMKPEVIPVPFPLILSMSQSGIGVGFSSKLPPHNVNEIADNIIKYLKTDKIDNLIPDFPTGGIILNNKNTIDNINNRGSGSVKIRGSAKIEGLGISITEIPYGVNREQIINKIIDLAKTDTLSEVSNVQDLSGKDKFEIYVKAKRGTDMEVLLEKLYKFTPLESNFSVNAMVLVDGLPKLLGTKHILKTWTNWRLSCIERDVQNQIQKLEKEIEQLQAYSIIKDNMQEFIKHMRFADELIPTLMKKLSFSENQAKFVSNMQIRNINEKYLNRKIAELKQKRKEKNKLEKLTYEDFKDILINDMDYVKKHFGHSRKTKIVNETKIKDKIKELEQEIKDELIDDSDYWIHVTKQGFIYKTEKKNNKITLAPKDKVIQQIKLNNKEDEIFAFTTDRNGVKEQIRNIPITKSNELGMQLDSNCIEHFGFVTEKIKYLLVFLTNGRVVKFSPESFRPGTNVFKPTHTDKFDITHVLYLEKDKKITVKNAKNKKIVIDTSKIRVTKSRTGTGQYINGANRADIKKILK